MIFRIWIPGRFSLTNKMLSNLRAAEHYYGRRPKGWRDAFAEETVAIRLATKAAAKDVAPGVVARCLDEVCALSFGVFGHRRHDPDAWYLLGKAVADGLADAGVIHQDRSDVWHTGGRVLQSRAEEVWWCDSHFGTTSPVPTELGVLVRVSFFERPVPRA